MSKLLSSVALAFAFVSAPGVALGEETGDEVIVTATRAQGGAERTTLGTSVTSIDAIDLELRQTRAVSDVLRDVPGIAVSRQGGVGALTQVRMRGAEANHTLVLIDGMEVADPYQGEFDFSTLIADDVARIEVLRGQQGALYGSDAIGGVIHYITASGAEAPGVRGRAEYGSFDTWNATVRVADVAGPVDFALSAGYQSTGGTPTSRFGTRDLAAQNSALSGRVVFTLADNFRIRAIGRYTQTDADTNGQDFNFPPGPTYGYVIDTNESAETTGAYGLVSAELDMLDGAWTHALTLQGVDASRDGYESGAKSSGDDGSRLKASYVTSFKFGSDAVAQTITGAADYERERFQNTSPFLSAAQSLQREIENVGLVAQYDAVINGVVGLGLDVRRDENDLFDDATTYRAQASYLLPSDTRLHAAFGTGIKNPGIFELFGFNPATFVGNPNLKPEKSEGWEAGIEQSFLDGAARIDVTYFDSKLTDEIYTVFGSTPPFFSTPDNRTTESAQSGVEVSGQILLGKSWRAFATYTWLDAQENGVVEVRRPENTGSANLSYRAPDDTFGAFLTVRYNGAQYDNNFTLTGGPRVLLSEYTLVNVGGDFRVGKLFDIYARVENALDEEYEDVYTYRTPGRAAFVGVRAGF